MNDEQKKEIEQIKEFVEALGKLAGLASDQRSDPKTASGSNEKRSCNAGHLKRFCVHTETWDEEVDGDHFFVTQDGWLQIFKCAKEGKVAAFFKNWDYFTCEEIEND